MSLIVVGSVAYDVIELPGKDAVAVLGGSATWFSAAAGLLTRSKLVGVVGDDFADDDVDFLQRRGVDLTGLERRPGATFRWHGRYHADMIGRDSLKTELGVFADFNPILPDNWRTTDVLFLGNIKPDLQESVLAQVEKAGFVGLDTIECWIDAFRDDLVRLMPKVDLLFLNDDEVRQLTGERDLQKAAGMILAMGAGALVIKRGEHGAMLFYDDGITLYPAFPIKKLVDPTGAGDCFAGGSLAYLDLVGDHGRDSIRASLAVGTVAASFCCEGFGPKSMEAVSLSVFKTRLSEYFSILPGDGADVISRLKSLSDVGR